MAVTDPVDARLLAALAEVGKAAVHELAARVGMDPKEVAYRLVGLSATGLPLLVGVESDPQGIRAALAGPGGRPAPPHQGTPPHSGPPPVHGAPSGAYPVHGTPSGQHPVPGPPSGPHQAYGTPSGQYPVHGTPSGQYQPPPPQHPAPPMRQAQPAPPGPAAPPAPGDPLMSTWGPPQSASWARGDQQAPAQPQPPAAGARGGRTGDTLETQGLEGERVAVQLLEVQDPADYLFGAAGYRLEEGERSIVVHTEMSNRGQIPFASLPDNYLELLTEDGRAVGKAPVALSSRQPYKIGVQPGETAGGHTVYVLPEATRVVAVRWSPRPEPDERTLTWSLED
ncbi:AsnC family protein [Amycolatopsis cihanbeyliensis]|uniref:AsnC-like helix-turn-helix protein n=1 Tax=Amycolatopsis cihanbeyliensis TaxID=1128664 RepID=A0A542DFS3_AMYCI|nr:AsnC family protein [Amycolatopsis cihanbeyliensis]TQJ01881.1 AsnC-like helix-turn-helix protein [Amycolatopsis cihanbeyliensis]